MVLSFAFDFATLSAKTSESFSWCWDNISVRETSKMPYLGERFAGHWCNAARRLDVDTESNILKSMGGCMTRSHTGTSGISLPIRHQWGGGFIDGGYPTYHQGLDDFFFRLRLRPSSLRDLRRRQ